MPMNYTESPPQKYSINVGQIGIIGDVKTHEKQ